MVMAFSAFVLMTRLPATFPGYALLIAPLMVGGVGSGLFLAPNPHLILSSAPPSRSASAGAMISTTRLVGSALGATLLTLAPGPKPRPGASVGFGRGDLRLRRRLVQFREPGLQFQTTCCNLKLTPADGGTHQPVIDFTRPRRRQRGRTSRSPHRLRRRKRHLFFGSAPSWPSVAKRRFSRKKQPQQARSMELIEIVPIAAVQVLTAEGAQRFTMGPMSLSALASASVRVGSGRVGSIIQTRRHGLSG